MMTKANRLFNRTINWALNNKWKFIMIELTFAMTVVSILDK